MSAYIQIPKYCKSRGYITIRDLGLNSVGGKLFLDRNTNGILDFSIFPYWFVHKLRTKTKELDVVVDSPNIVSSFVHLAQSWDHISSEPYGEIYRLKNSLNFYLDFYPAESKLVEPEIWISKDEDNKIKISKNSNQDDDDLNTIKFKSVLMLQGLNTKFTYGVVPSIIRTRPEKKQTTTRSLLIWVYKDEQLTKVLPKKTSDPEEARICFSNELNNAGMKVGERKKVEICFDYIRRVPC